MMILGLLGAIPALYITIMTPISRISTLIMTTPIPIRTNFICVHQLAAVNKTISTPISMISMRDEVIFTP